VKRPQSATCSAKSHGIPGNVRGTHPERALEQTLRRGEALAAGERILIACSGGPDSVGLAAALAALASSMQWTLVAGHVNHGVRASAWQDEAVVLAAGAALGIPVKVAAPHVQAKSEAALREARYGALADLAAACGAGVIATAHTAEDQTETVLLSLFRGAGPAGIAGMPVRRALAPGVDLARPLLREERAVLRAYVDAAGLPYAIDPTNSNLELRRNAVRQALAGLRPLFPRLDAAVARAAQVVADEGAGTSRASLRRKIRDELERQDALRSVDFEHVEAAVAALERGGSGLFHMARGVELKIEGGRLDVLRRRP